MIHIPLRHAGNSIDLGNAVYFITEELNTDGTACPVGRINLQCISANPELITGEIHVITLIADLRKLSKHMIHGILLSHTKGDHHTLIIDRVTQTVQAADRRNHNYIPTLKKCGGCAVTQTVDLLINGRILLDIGIRVGNICFRLIIIIVGDKILHRVIGEKLTEFCAELCCQGLIVGKNQGRLIDFFNNRSHGKGFAGTGYTQ